MIVFVAEMRNPKTHASSTQIMTRNLLYGFYQIQKELVFVPVIANVADKKDIVEYYSGLYTDIIFAQEKSRCKGSVSLRQISWLLNACLPPRSIVPDKLFNLFKPNSELLS